MMKTAHMKQQRGAALITSLVILVLVTLMGLTTMKAAAIQEKMAGGDADKSLAFQAAEMALRDAELNIRNNLTSASGFADGCKASLCLAPTDGSSLADSVDWTSTKVAEYGSSTSAAALGGVSAQPRYIIEVLPDMKPPLGNGSSVQTEGTPYRITAIGFGRQPDTRVRLQSVYYKP